MFRDAVDGESRPSFPTRRDFLKLSLLGAGWGLAGAAGLLGATGALAANVPEGIDHLNGGEYAVFAHLVAAALPVEETSLPTPEAVSVMQTLDAALLAGMAPHILAGLKGGIAFFNEGPKETFGGRTFTQLSLDEARRFCDGWADAEAPEKRGIVMGMKKLVGLAYWSNPKTWPSLGYVGPITDRTGIPALGNAPLPA